MALYLQKYRSLCILCLFSLIVLLAIYIFLRQSGDLEQSLYPLFGSIVLLFLIVFIRIQDARIFGELSTQVRGGQVLSKTQLDALVQKKARTASLLLELKGIQAFAQGEHEEGIRMLQEAWAKIQDKHGKDWQRIPLRTVTIRCAFPWPMVWILWTWRPPAQWLSGNCVSKRTALRPEKLTKSTNLTEEYCLFVKIIWWRSGLLFVIIEVVERKY